MALVNGGFLHYTDMKKFLKNLLLIKTAGQIWNNFTGIRVGISGRPDCPIRASIATGKLPSPFVSPLEKEIFFSETTGQISRKKFTGMSLGWPFSNTVRKFWSVHKHGSGKWGLFALYRHEEILKKSSSYKKPLVRFWNNFTGIRVWH